MHVSVESELREIVTLLIAILVTILIAFSARCFSAVLSFRSSFLASFVASLGDYRRLTASLTASFVASFFAIASFVASLIASFRSSSFFLTTFTANFVTLFVSNFVSNFVTLAILSRLVRWLISNSRFGLALIACFINVDYTSLIVANLAARFRIVTNVSLFLTSCFAASLSVFGCKLFARLQFNLLLLRFRVAKLSLIAIT